MDSVSSQPIIDKHTHRRTRAEALANAVARVEACLPPTASVNHPILVIFSGVPGSGKSYLARRLQPHLTASMIETDQVRYVLFRSPCYSAPENGWVYTVCHDLIAHQLAQGQSVIFDATNLIEHSRRELYKIASRSQARLVIVRTVAPDAVIRQRILERCERIDPANHSDADIAIYDRLRQTEQPIHRQHIVIDTTQDCEEAIQRILRECYGESMAQPQNVPAYISLDHTADLAMRVWGHSREELFANAATGMFAQMTDLAHACASVQRAVSVEGDDDESLLVAWLSELLYLRDVHREAYVSFRVRFPAPGRLEAVADGCPSPSFDRPVKAVTYHGLKIEHKAGRYETTIVFDV